MSSNKLRLLMAALLIVGVGICAAEPALGQCQIAKLLGSDTVAGDGFGISVAISVDTAIVGARENNDGAPDTGAAYIFQGSPAGYWAEVKKLNAGAAAYDHFGGSVSICGDIAIVGAPRDDQCGEDAGAGYIFQRDWGGADNWGLVKKLVAGDCAAGDDFGRSVSCSGDTAIIGAPGDDDSGNGAGAAYLYQQNWGGADNWGEVKKLTACTTAGAGTIGHTVAISGDIAIIGAESDSTAAHHGGVACIFERDAGGADSWGKIKVLTASDAANGDNFGSSVSISGDTAIVGAAGVDDGGMRSGAAYVVQRDWGGADNWGEVKKLSAGDAASDDFFGESASISGDTVVIGAFRCPNDPVCDTGSAYIFHRSEGGDGNWGEVTKLTACDAAAGDRFGLSVSISGDTVIAGAHGNDDLGAFTGSAYVFALDEDCRCPGIPAVSEWGLLVTTLLFLVAGTLLYPRRRAATA